MFSIADVTFSIMTTGCRCGIIGRKVMFSIRIEPLAIVFVTAIIDFVTSTWGRKGGF